MTNDLPIAQIYIISLMDGRKIKISRGEFQKINFENKLIAIPRLANGIINLNSLVSIMPSGLFETEEHMKEGFISSGERVIKRNGTWVLADNPTTIVDRSYFKEILSNNPNELCKTSLIDSPETLPHYEG
jgi:hypothetical protein